MQVMKITGNLHEFTLSKTGKSMGLPPGQNMEMVCRWNPSFGQIFKQRFWNISEVRQGIYFQVVDLACVVMQFQTACRR